MTSSFRARLLHPQTARSLLLQAQNFRGSRGFLLLWAGLELQPLPGSRPRACWTVLSRPAWQLRGRCRGARQGCCPGTPALEGLPRLPYRQLQGDGAAAGGPRDGGGWGGPKGGVASRAGGAGTPGKAGPSPSG